MKDELEEMVATEIMPVVNDALVAAWDQGYASGRSNAMRYMSDEPNVSPTPNPYRKKVSGA